MGRHHTKTDIVEVVNVVVVAVRTARVPLIVVEGTAAQHSGVDRPAPSQGATPTLYAKIQEFPASRREGSVSSFC